ncbi:MAG: site-2 protease family protein, partial [Clostridia bacterium]
MSTLLSFSSVMTYIGYILVAILVLLLMVTIHEFGHYVAGKLLGFKIDEFSVGFGKALFQRTNKNTGE